MYLIGEKDEASGAHKRFRPQDITARACRDKMVVSTPLQWLLSKIVAINHYYSTLYNLWTGHRMITSFIVWQLFITSFWKCCCILNLHIHVHCIFQETARKPLKDKLKNFLEVCSKFQPVMRYFFMENFSQPSVWFERRLAYTKSVSTTSIGIVNHSYITYYTKISVISAQYSTCTSYLFCYSGIHSWPGRPTYTEHFDWHKHGWTSSYRFGYVGCFLFRWCLLKSCWLNSAFLKSAKCKRWNFPQNLLNRNCFWARKNLAHPRDCSIPVDKGCNWWNGGQWSRRDI